MTEPSYPSSSSVTYYAPGPASPSSKTVLLDTRQTGMNLSSLLDGKATATAAVGNGSAGGSPSSSPTANPDASIAPTAPTTPATAYPSPAQSTPVSPLVQAAAPLQTEGVPSSIMHDTARPLTVIASDSLQRSTSVSSNSLSSTSPSSASSRREDVAVIHAEPATGYADDTSGTSRHTPSGAQPQPPSAPIVSISVDQSEPSTPVIPPPPSPAGFTFAVPPATPVHPPLPTPITLNTLPPPPSPINASIIQSLTHPPPPPFPFNRRDYPLYSGPLDGTVALTGKYSYRYASGWYYVGQFRDSLRRGEGELYYSNGGDDYVAEKPADYDELAPRYNRFLADNNGEMKALDLMRNYPEAFEPAGGPRPVFKKTGQCEYPGCSGLLFYRARHHCRQCGLNFCGEHGNYRTTLPRLYYPLDVPMKVCKSCYENDRLSSKTVTGDIYLGSFKFNYNWGRGVYIFQTKKERYEGDFDEGRMEGKGNYRFSNGDIFTGDYRNDKREGKGVLHSRLNGLQQLQQDREELLSLERRKQQSADDVLPTDEDDVLTLTSALSLPPPAYPSAKGEVLYSGGWVNDLPEGVGVSVTNAVFYVGDYVAGERTGRASIVMKRTGERYDGEVKNGVREGKGVMTSAWGVYDGLWKDNQRTGHGRWEYRRKTVPSWHGLLTFSTTGYLNVYEGSWYNDAGTGQGRHVYWDGSHYEGGHLALLPHGKGVMTYCNHDQFLGEWVRGKRHGKGKMVYSTEPYKLVERVDRDGRTVQPTEQEQLEAEAMAGWQRPLYVEYDGDWANDLPHGYGTCLYPDGTIYSGQLQGAQATGQGRTVYANGDRYEGGHVAGIREGRGVYTWKQTGNAYDGQWKEGRRYIPAYTDTATSGKLALDDRARWSFLSQHSYRNAETGEKYEGESLYGAEGEWAKSIAQKRQSTSLAMPYTALHPSNPDSPTFVRHGLGVLRATPSNTVYSHWMGEWQSDMRHGAGRLYLLSSKAGGSASFTYNGHVIEGVWTADQPPHTGHIQALTSDPSMAYSFHGLLSASILPISSTLVQDEGQSESSSSDIHVNSSIDLHTWSRLTIARLPDHLDRCVSHLSSPRSAAFINVNIPLSSAFALSPTGVSTVHFPNGDSYFGQFWCGSAHGRGQCKYVYAQRSEGSKSAAIVSAHQIYTGHWHAGRREGLGQMVFADNSTYIGYWKQGERSGLGVFTATLQPPSSSAPGSVVSSIFSYEGEWVHDTPNGRASLRCRAFTYEGEFVNGLFHGHGRLLYANGDSFNGQFRSGRREGSGHFTSAEDHTYLGALWYGRFHGYGSASYTLVIPMQSPAVDDTQVVTMDPMTPAAVVELTYTGEYYYGYKTGRGHLNVTVTDKLHQQLVVEYDYVGGFLGDQFNGSGVFSVYTPVGASTVTGAVRVLASQYDGEWVSGKRHGTGSQYFSDGRIYQGEWVRDYPHGSGRMQYPLLHDHTGEQERDALPIVEVAEYKGAWAMGVRRGSGTLLYSNGDSYTGEIADNHRHGSGALTLANGDTAKGIWKDDKKDGRCVYTFYRPVGKGGKSVPASIFPPSSSSPLHYLSSVESHWKEDVLDGVVLFRFQLSTTAYLTAIHTKWTDGFLSHTHPFQVVYAESEVYQGQLVATTTDTYHFDLYQLAEMAVGKSQPAVMLPRAVGGGGGPTFEDCVQRLSILSNLSPVFPVTGCFFPFHVFAVVFCHTRVSRHGVGLSRSATGEEYVGQWKNNRRHGRGQQVFVTQPTHHQAEGSTDSADEQSVYVGSWQDDVMHGRGSLYIESRQVKLTTMFARGKANTEIKGKGRLENYGEGSVYSGDLSSLTILNGIGQLVHSDGSSYQGTFVNGQPEGLGRTIDSDGSVHIGYYLRGMRYGKGMSVSADGCVEKGSWRLSEKDGMFSREKNGQVTRVKYAQGKEVWSGRM